MRLFVSSLSNSEYAPPEPTNPTTVLIEETTRWVIGSRDNMQISVSSGELQTSLNSGDSFDYSLSFAEANYTNSCWIFSNGRILLVTQTNRFYVTDSTLSFITEKFMYEADGETLYQFTPVPEGDYFTPIKFGSYYNGSDMVLGFNYQLTDSHAIVWYSDDFGETLKISLDFRDTPYIARHLHHVDKDPYTDNWYFNTGDFATITGGQSQAMWFQGTFNSITKVWTWNLIDFGFPIIAPTHLKTAGWYFRQIDGESYIYWGAETSGNNDASRGLWKCKLSEFSDVTKHVRVLEFDPNGTDWVISDLEVDHNTGLVVGTMDVEGVFQRLNRIILATDWGEGDYQIKEMDGYRLRNLSSHNDRGLYRMDTDRIEPLQGSTIFIRPGLDLFNNLGYEVGG